MRLTRRFVLAALPAAACSARLGRFPFDGDPIDGALPADTLHIRFFSVGCFLVQWQGLGLLTDPFFTHVSFRDVALGHTEPDPAAIADARPYLGDVQAVVVGHSHYDHILGLRPVAPLLAPDAQIFASQTAAHIYSPESLPRRLTVVNDVLATRTQPGTWQPAAAGRMRVLSIRSGHPDNVPGIHVYHRPLRQDRPTPATRASHYQEGLTLAFLVDWLDPDGQVAFRVYVQTSSVGPPLGLAPQALLDEHPVDVALLAMDCANFLARDQPNVLDHIDPRMVVFCHWGNFFRSKDQEPREIVKVNLPWLREVITARPDGDRYRFPGWHTAMHLPRRG
jgi:L-ascorbate metabolism protein UlaG (beta-lactamase superfamily)